MVMFFQVMSLLFELVGTTFLEAVLTTREVHGCRSGW